MWTSACRRVARAAVGRSSQAPHRWLAALGTQNGLPAGVSCIALPAARPTVGVAAMHARVVRVATGTGDDKAPDSTEDDAAADRLLDETDEPPTEPEETGEEQPMTDNTLEDEADEPRQNLKPSELVAHLDQYIVGQLAAKKSVAVALRNRWRRHSVKPEMKQDITPKNILMVGPTGCGKTEIARRLALITDSPFLKVEATKFTEVGFHGKDADSIIKDLVRVGINQLKSKKKAKLMKEMAGRVEESILLALVRSRMAHPSPVLPSATKSTSTLDWSEPVRKSILAKAKSNATQWAADVEAYRKGDLDALKIEIPMPKKVANDFFGGGGSGGAASGFAMSEDDGTQGRGGAGLEGLGIRLVGLDLLGAGSGKAGDELEPKTVTVAEARAALLEHHTTSRLRPRDLAKRAIKMVESDGIVFLDEIDKICSSAASRRFSSSGDASAEGVQRDLLPLVEGTTVNTPHGPVNTDHILFICSGAFHQVNVGDMLPELQGRLPVRVELKALTEDDFYRILTVPTNNLIMQQCALLKTDHVELTFTDGALKEIARVACEVNRTLDNIGARRLNTVIQRIMDDHSFTAADLPAGTKIEIGVEYVREKIKPLMKNADLSKYVL